MTECYKCGISSEKATLYEGLSPAGIVNVCRKCFFLQKMPLLEHKKVDWTEIDQPRTVRQRLSRMSGFKEKAEDVKHMPTRKDQELRNLVEKNFQENLMAPSEAPQDLIINFNWIIMRKRRALKLSLKDFADRIYVPESIADSIERGILPRDYKALIRKVESSLDVNLFIEPKFRIRPEDLAVEARIPSGALISEIKEKYPENKESLSYSNKPKGEIENSQIKESGGFSDTHEIDASDLNLENVEDLFGVPDESDLEASPKMDKEPKELSDEDVKRFAWGN